MWLIMTYFLLCCALSLSWAQERVTLPAGEPMEFVTNFDRIPNFAQSPTIASTKAGKWSDPQTWSTGQLPGDADIVLISHQILYDMPSATVQTIGVASGAALHHAVDRSTALHVGTLLVQPGGTYTIGTPDAPLQPPATVALVLRKTPLDTINDGVGVFDPFQFGTGLLVMDGGTLMMHGAAVTPAWVGLGAAVKTGDMRLTLATAPQGWQVGDRLVLPDTRMVMLARDYASPRALWPKEPQWEVRTIEQIEGTVVTLTTPVRYAHDPRAHVENLSRTIEIRSEDPAGVRGHVFATRHAMVDIRYVRFADLGRTTVHPRKNTSCDQHTLTCVIGSNQVGRYMMHLHHVIGPQGLPETTPQFTLRGNAFEGAQHWAIAVHDSHYGLLQGNTCYNARGGCYATEDGSESYNVIDGNMAVRCEGDGEPVSKKGRAPGGEGSCFWFRQANNWIVNNVAANARTANYMILTQGLVENANAIPVRYPLWKGADTSASGQYVTSDTLNHGRFGLNPLAFDNNHAYGGHKSGVELWRSGGSAEKLFMLTNLWAWHNRGAQVTAGYASNFALYTSTLACEEQSIALARFAPRHSEHQGITVEFAPGSMYALDTVTIDGCARGVYLTVINRQDAGLEVLLKNLILRNKLNVRVAAHVKSTAPIKVQACNIDHRTLSGQTKMQIGARVTVTETCGE